MKRPLLLAAFILLSCIWFYTTLRVKSPPSWQQLEGSKIQVLGRLSHKEYKSDQWILYLKDCRVLNTIDTGGQNQFIQTELGLLCSFKEDEEYSIPNIGSIIQINGTLSIFQNPGNPGEFNSKKYYESIGYQGRLYHASIEEVQENRLAFTEGFYRARLFLSKKLPMVMSEKNAAFLNAMILGSKTELDQEQKELFVRNGISHVLSISGFHISLVAAVLSFFLEKFPISKKKQAILSSCILLSYGFLTGMGVSTLRALMMSFTRQSAILLKRSYDQKTALALSSILILMVQPQYLYHTGFQLSFLAMAGISYSNSQKKSVETFFKKLMQSLKQGCMISIFSIPILASTFYEITFTSLILNLIILPLTTVILYIGFITLVLTCLHPLLGQIPGFILDHILWGQEFICKIFDGLWLRSYICGVIPSWKIVIYFLFLALFFLSPKKLRLKQSWKGIVFLFLNILVLLMPWHRVWKVYQPPEITMLDVGQGEAVLLQSPSGHSYLIDGGSLSKQDIGKYTLVPALKYYGIRSLDMIFITHVDKDHISGILWLLEMQKTSQISIKALSLPRIKNPDETYEEIIRLCRESGVVIYFLEEGDNIEDDCFQLQVLHPEFKEEVLDRNDNSLVLHFQYGYFKGLFTGDISEKVEKKLQKKVGDKIQNLQLLKAAHHGSDYSNSPEFLHHINPSYVIISAGKYNSYGHPGKRFLADLEQEEIKYHVTAYHGAIFIKIHQEKKEFSVETYTKY